MHTCAVSVIECGPLMAQNFQKLVVPSPLVLHGVCRSTQRCSFGLEAELPPTYMLPMVYVQHVLLVGIR